MFNCLKQASPVTSPNRSLRQSQRHGGSGRIIKSILSKEAKQAQSPPTMHNSDQPSILDKDKRPPKHPNSRMIFMTLGMIMTVMSVILDENRNNYDGNCCEYCDIIENDEYDVDNYDHDNIDDYYDFDNDDLGDTYDIMMIVQVIRVLR